MNHHIVQDRTEVVPFANAGDLQQRVARSLSLLNEWHAAISGRAAMAEVLTVLVRQTGARNVALYRHRRGRTGQIAGAVRPHEGNTPETSRGGLTGFLKVIRADHLTPGSIWQLSRLKSAPGFARSAAAHEWQHRDDLKDVVLVILQADGDQVDALELIFDTTPDVHPELPPVLMTQALADAWAMRAPGLVSRMIRKNERSRGTSPARDLAGRAILSGDNPCALSRAEQRVCHLLAAGQKAKAIAVELGVSVATVRTHLRNIYAKTDTGGQVELITLISDNNGLAA